MRGLCIGNRAVRALVPTLQRDKPNGRVTKLSSCSEWRKRSHRTSGFCSTGRLKGTRFGRRVDPHLKPQLQHQECPQSGMMISCERAVFPEQVAHIVRAEKASFSRALRQQRFVSEFLELAAEPVIDGTAEP